jgi:chromate reductase
MNVEQSGPRLLTVCGSLQRRSANRAILRLARAHAEAAGAIVEDFDRLAELPAFDPDRGDEAIESVQQWRRQVASADAVLVAAPEYAGAIAGAVKNAFDWLVGSGELYRKPVALLSVGTSGGRHARRMMAQTLTWQGAYVVADLGVASPRTKLDERGGLHDMATAAALRSLVRALVDATTGPSRALVGVATAVLASLGVEEGHVVPAD